MLKGMTVTLIVQTKSGTDSFGTDIYTETSVSVDNVIVYPSSETEVLETVNLYGKKAVFTLCIPKGDTNDWENTYVEFFGKRWRTIGYPKEYMADLIPLQWNKQVRVESIV